MPLLDGATYVFDRAYNDYTWFHDMTERRIYFVGRMKSNAKYEVIEKLPAIGVNQPYGRTTDEEGPCPAC